MSKRKQPPSDLETVQAGLVILNSQIAESARFAAELLTGVRQMMGMPVTKAKPSRAKARARKASKAKRR